MHHFFYAFFQQMCVEEEQLLPYDGWLFRPLEPPETDPLTGCCISVRYNEMN